MELTKKAELRILSARLNKEVENRRADHLGASNDMSIPLKSVNDSGITSPDRRSLRTLTKSNLSCRSNSLVSPITSFRTYQRKLAQTTNRLPLVNDR